jgi:hypothetical protein
MSKQSGLAGTSAARPWPVEQMVGRLNEPLIPYGNNARLHSGTALDRSAAANTVDQKTYWGLGEVVIWIRTRDHERVAALSGLSETDAMMRATFTLKKRLDPRSLLQLSATSSDADREAAAPLDRDKAERVEEPVPMPPDAALDDLQRKLRSGRLALTAIKRGQSSDEQIPVPPAELNDLVFRFTDDPVASVGLWSRSRRLLVWRSPQFLRADVIRVWPARNSKTAAVSAAILRHLCKIMLPGAPLTKVEAQRRCMAEVPNAYPAAFKKAWAQLEPSMKRGRGQHGSWAR